jgi:hypothetical protein
MSTLQVFEQNPYLHATQIKLRILVFLKIIHFTKSYETSISFKYLSMHNRVIGYRSGGPGFDFRRYQKKKVGGLERGPLSLEYN